MTQQEHFIQNVRPLLEKSSEGADLTEEEEQIVIQWCEMMERLSDNSQN